MPSHEEDLKLILELKNIITHHIFTYQNHNIMLCDDFNRNFALIGRYQNTTYTLAQHQNLDWKNFTLNLNLTYIRDNISYTRQGGHNYIHTQA